MLSNERVLRVRDHYLIREIVSHTYTDPGIRTASWAPSRETLQGIVEGTWETRLGISDREAAFGILKRVKQLVDLVRRGGRRAWDLLERTLGLDDLGDLGPVGKVKAIAGRVRDFVKRGRDALGKVLKKVSQTFPLSLYFMPHGKAPSLTDLMTRIAKKSPTLWRFLQRVKGKADSIDAWMKKYVPRLSKVLLGAIYIFVWTNVAELSWDLEGLLAGFSGNISLSELLASLPESTLGLLFASFGLGYGALPVTIIARIVWLVAQKYVEWVPGRGLVVHWDRMGVSGESAEFVPV